ncbi:universal stress protein [Streptomyces sp. F63]|uniref:universal stress protein n=1 Tax=Streptomyces sp. F63 TaxID=2824887 RepID=UPI001B39605D|nr:universal stress protein [Streptomyces sp. F63]MBQ0988212.1 universal stress protein [Streptomyces sp. F63]
MSASGRTPVSSLPPGPPGGHRAPRVVVGVDGSAGSVAALRWAAARAPSLGAGLVVVHAWEPATGRRAPYAPAASRPSGTESRGSAGEVLERALRAGLGPSAEAGVRAVLAEGPPAAVLLRYADDALLLVLGRHPPGPGPGRPVPPNAGGGPVARDCLRHARCPVVVVPGEPALPHGGHGAPGTGPRAYGAEPYRAGVYDAHGAVGCGPPAGAFRPPRAAYAAHRH